MLLSPVEMMCTGLTLASLASIDGSFGRGVSGLKQQQHTSAAPSVVVIAVRNRKPVELHA